MGTPPPIPEILSPNGSYAPPPQPVRRSRRSWSVAPATYLLLGINCLVFLAMVATKVSPMNPTINQLMHWGADNAGAVLIQGQWWRIVTAMFVHVGLIHLATNMWCLWNLGLLAEPLVGSAGLLSAYILTGAAGNLLSTFVNWWVTYPELSYLTKKLHGPISADQLLSLFPAGAGASGAVFGLAGVLIVLLKSPRLPVPTAELRKLRKSVIYFAAINLVIGIATLVPGFGVHIDNMAHIGGFLCGLFFATPLVPRIGSPRPMFQRRLRIALGMVVGWLVLFSFYLSQLPK
jgi:rhomboid protease GluP